MNRVEQKRAELTQQEQKLVAELENKSRELEAVIQTLLKKSLYIGGGLAAGYTLYKLLASSSDSAKKLPKKKTKTLTTKASAPNAILSFVLKHGLPLLIDVLKNKR